MSWLKDDNENKKEGTADKLSSFSSATNNTVHPTKQAEYQYQPVQQQPLFRFSTPTMGEAFAVNQKAIKSGADANSMNSGFNSFVNSYDLYRSPTSNAYGWLNSNGFNTANGVPLGYGANGKYTNGGSLSSTGKTQNEQAAYWWGQYEEDTARTSKLRTEYDAFLEELTHEANSPMRTMNDADLIQHTMSKYKEVVKLSDSYASQVPLQLTESFDNPYDAAYAALFKAYGNNSTGSVYGDSAVYNSGGGNGWVKNEDTAARLDFTSGRYDPYVLGSTMKDASSYFGTYVFDDKWLEDNAGVMNGTDATAIRNYQSVYSAYEFTTKAKEELADMNAYIADCLASGVSPDEVKRFIDGIDNSSFPSLTKLAKSLSTGKLVDTTSAIDFDPVGMFDKYVADYNEQARKNNTAEYVDTMDASLGYTGTVKAPTVTAQNGQIIVDHGNADERFAWMNGLPSETTAFAAEINSAIKNGTATAQDAYAGTLGVMGNLAVSGDYFSALGTIDRYQQISDKLDSISPELVASKEATDAALDSAVTAFADYKPGIYSEVLASRGEAGVADFIFNSFGDPDARPDDLPDELLAYVDSRKRMESLAHNFQLWQEDLDTMQNQYDEAIKLQDDLIFHYNLSEDLRTMTEIPSNGRTTIPELMEIAYFYGFNNLEDAQYAYNTLKNAGAGEEVLAKIQKDVDKYTYKALSAKEDFAKYGTIDGFNAATREILVEYGDEAFSNGLHELLMNSDSILTDEEKKIAAYIYYTSNKNVRAVNDYLNSIDRTYTDATQEEAAQMKALAEAKDEEGLSLFIATHFGSVYDRSKANSADFLQTIGKESPIVASLISLATNAANSFMTPAQMIATALGADEKLMDKLFSANTMTQNLRAGASSQMDEVGKFFYDAGMSIADNAITMAMGYAGAGGKTGEALSKSVGRYSELLMGSQAASSAMQEALDKGYDGPVAVLLGLASGALESITEKMDIDRFFSEGGFIKKIVSSMTGEFSEEFASEVGNAIADSLADLLTDNGLSDTQAAYRSFREQGMSHNDAVWAVIKGKFNDAFMAGLSGSLSGIAFGTSGYVRGTIAENRYNREQQQYKRDMEERTSAFEAANGEIKSVFDAFRTEYEAGLDAQAAVPKTNRTLNALQQKINEKLGPSIENFREKRKNYNAARKNLNAVNAKPVSIVDSSTFDTSEAAESYMNSEYVAPAGETLNSVQERANARDEVKRTKEEMQTARKDMQKASDESGFRLPKSYDRRNIRTQQTIADDGSAFAREILALDEASVSGQKNASATLEAVLADGAAGMHPDSAKAAVNALARRYGDNAIRKVLPVLMDAKRTGADPVAVKRAIIMAALNPDSSTAAIIEASDSFTNPSKNLVSALAIDVKNGLGVAEGVNREMLPVYTAQMIADADSSAVVNANDAIKNAQEKMNTAEAALQDAKDSAETANEFYQQMRNEFMQNPADTAALKRMQKAQKAYFAAQKAVDASQKAYDSAVIKYEDTKAEKGRIIESIVHDARANAAALINERNAAHEQAVTEAAVKTEHEVAAEQKAKEEAHRVEVEQRKANKVDAVNATNAQRNDALEKLFAKHPELTEQDKQALRERYGNGTRVRTVSKGFADKLSKKFNVRIEMTDGIDSGNGVRYDGRYDSKTNTVSIRSDMTEGEALERVVLHELTHSIEGSAEYNAIAQALKELAYGENISVFEQDVKDRIASYSRKGVELSVKDAEHEVIADLTKRVLYATQEDIDRLVGGNPTVGQRILDSIKSVIDKIKGVDTSTEDRLNKVRQMFENAIAKQHGGNADGSNADGVQYSLSDSDYSAFDDEFASIMEEEGFDTKNLRQHLRQFNTKTVQNADFPSDRVKEYLFKNAEYVPSSWNSTMERAVRHIENVGYETAKGEFLAKKNFYNKETQALGMALFAAASMKGDYNAEADIGMRYAEMGTDIAKALNIRRMFNSMTTPGRIAYVNRVVNSINEEYEARGTDTRVEVPKGFVEELENAKTDEERERITRKAVKNVAEQMVPDWHDRLRNWRIFSMLFNPRTHVRNIAGNALFSPVVALKNRIGAQFENAFTHKGENSIYRVTERTKNASTTIRQEYLDFAKAVRSRASVEGRLNGDGNKYNDGTLITRNKPFFTVNKNNVFEKLAQFNGDLLEKEDAIFLNRHFDRAFAGYLQANDADVKALAEGQRKDFMERAIEYAVNEAQKATYHDFNEFAQTISNITRIKPTDGFFARTLRTGLSAAVPFVKTPANIIRRGFEYSPVNLMYALSAGRQQLKNGDITSTEFVDKISCGLTGTALTALGALLSSLGIIKVKPDELDKMTGAQDYSIEIFGGSYTIDWITPASMPMFVGSALYDSLANNKEGFSLEGLWNSLGTISEPVLNLTMLDGVNNLFTTSAYSENGIVLGLAETIGSNYVTQYVPSLLGAVARIIDPTRRTTYVDKNIGIPASVQRTFDKIVNKIPGLSFTGQPYQNAWGESQGDSFVERTLENIVSPGYWNARDISEVENALMELYDATGDDGIIPKSGAKYITINKQRIDLTGEQYASYNEDRGQTARMVLANLFASKSYDMLTEEQKAAAVKKVYDYATQRAKHGMFEEYGWDKWVYNNTPETVIGYILKSVRN